MTTMQFTFEDGDWDAKIIRRVRTQRGVRRYKKPIGSIIVSSSRSSTGKRALRNIQFDDGGRKKRGTIPVRTSSGEKFSVSKRPRGESGKKYRATDQSGAEVASADDQESALVALDRYVARKKKASKEPTGNVAKLPTDRKPRRTRSGERGGDDNVVEMNPDPGGAARPKLSRRQERQHEADNAPQVRKRRSAGGSKANADLDALDAYDEGRGGDSEGNWKRAKKAVASMEKDRDRREAAIRSASDGQLEAMHGMAVEGRHDRVQADTMVEMRKRSEKRTGPLVRGDLVLQPGSRWGVVGSGGGSGRVTVRDAVSNDVRTYDADDLQRPKPSGPMTGGVRRPDVPRTPPSRRPKETPHPARQVQSHRRSATIALGKIETIERNLADGIYDTPEERASARAEIEKLRKRASDAIEKMLQAAESSGDASLIAKAKQGRGMLK